jgi:translation elongation factor EF-4
MKEEQMTELPEKLQEVLDKIVKELKENSQEMDDECKKVLYDNLWDLYEDL